MLTLCYVAELCIPISTNVVSHCELFHQRLKAIDNGSRGCLFYILLNNICFPKLTEKYRDTSRPVFTVLIISHAVYDFHFLAENNQFF